MKKKLIFPAMLVCLAVLGLVLAGCPTEPGNDGGKIPANLRNTKWEKGSDTLEFKPNQIILIQSGRTRTLNVVSAVENGQIMASEVYTEVYTFDEESYVGDPEEFCSSYTINGSALTLAGGRSFTGTWTKSSSDNNSDDDENNGSGNKNAELVGTWYGEIQILTITETTFKMSIGGMEGPFTYNGTTLTYQSRPSFTIKISKTSDTTMTISDYSSTDTDDFKEYLEGTYTKQP
jgi:hypothetical protein